MICQVGGSTLSDLADLELAHRHSAVCTVTMCVHTGTGLEGEDAFVVINDPDARKGNAHVVDQRFAARLEGRLLIGDREERAADLGPHSVDQVATPMDILRQDLFIVVFP